jgi:two-component system phosphate regulon sensor histidine kinase PhoR
VISSIVSSEKPRTFLMTGSPRANAVGLALEKLSTRLRESERAAQEGTRSIEAILGALPDGLAVVDAQRRLQITNSQFRRLFGVDENYARSSLLEATRDGEVDAAAARALANNEVARVALKVSRTSDAALQIETSVVPFAGTGERGGGAVLLFRDVTQMQQVEAMRRDFVANVSHELRTPLSIFRGYLETLLDDPHQPPDELVRILEVMDRHAERLTLLVEDILSLAQLESPSARLELTEIYLPEFLDGIARDWERRFGAKLLRASLDAPPDLPVIRADEHRLQEVIYNLLDNAVKYSQPEGKIRLKAQRVGDRVRIAVADEGVGIPRAMCRGCSSVSTARIRRAAGRSAERVSGYRSSNTSRNCTAAPSKRRASSAAERPSRSCCRSSRRLRRRRSLIYSPKRRVKRRRTARPLSQNRNTKGIAAAGL